MLWGVGGILGAFGAWLIIFDVGSRAKITRRLVIFMVSAGIAAASVILIPLLLQPGLLPDAFFILCLASATGVGVFQICKFSSASPLYSFPGTAWHQMEASDGLVAHLKSLGAKDVPAKLRVQTRFGRFESFRIIDLAGFPIDGGSARNGNQPEPPFPTEGLDDDAARSGP